MHKKLYISPEFEWLYINLLNNALSASLPDNYVDENDMDDDEPTDPTGGDDYGVDNGGEINPEDLI